MPRPAAAAVAAARFSATEMAHVVKLLCRRFSSEQIVGWWKKTGGLCISHETIYRFIRWDRRAGGDLWRST